MRAIDFVGPGQVVLVDDAPRPEPADGEILVQCSHVALCGSNVGPYLFDGRWNAETPRPPGWLGHENMGTIIESRAPGWEAGTLVLAHPEDYNGFAELIVSKPDGLARLPSDLADPGAMIAAQPLSTVLHALSRTGPVINQRCAVVGQGPIGLIFSHLLRRMGAAQVIGIDKVAWRLNWAKRFGATHVIDAQSEDLTEAVREMTGGEMVDLCVEAVGHPEALSASAFLPRRQGRLFPFGIPHYDNQEFPWFHTVSNGIEIVTSSGPDCKKFFQTAVQMIVDGHVDLAEMVTPRMPWAEAPRAFQMYADPASAEGSLKLTLLL